MSGSPPAKGWRLFQRKGVAFVVLVLSLFVTVIAWHTAPPYVLERTAAGFNADNVASTVRDRVAQYEQILWGGTAFFASGTTVDRRAWRAFVDAQRIHERFPGMLGVGFSLRVPRAQLARHTASVRAEGFPNYAVWPGGARDEYHAIIYLEPFSGSNLRAFGYDMSTNPVQRTAMERARDTGLPAVSGKVVLVQETSKDAQPGFLMYVPVYANGMPHATIAERRAALIGFVYSPFTVNDLMAGMFGQTIRTPTSGSTTDLWRRTWRSFMTTCPPPAWRGRRRHPPA